jgi:hypothetical protein
MSIGQRWQCVGKIFNRFLGIAIIVRMKIRMEEASKNLAPKGGGVLSKLFTEKRPFQSKISPQA